MKKTIALCISILVVFSLAVPASASVGNNVSYGAFSDLLDDLFGDSDDFGEVISDAISDALDDLEDAMPEVISSIQENVPDIADSVQDALPEIIDSVQEALPEIADSVQEALPELISESGIADIYVFDDDFDGSSEALEELRTLLDELFNNSEIDDISIDDISSEGSELISGVSGVIGNKILDELFSKISEKLDSTDPSISSDGSDEPADYAGPALFGGWKVNDQAESLLSDEEMEIFDEAVSSLPGGAYTPIAVIATQVVAGTNYAYLCLHTPVNAEELTSWYIVTLYEDLSGSVEVMNMEEIELNDIETMDTAYNPAFVGSWTAPSEVQPASLPEDASDAFEAAMEGYVGVSYSPIALLGTQLVSGTNYKFLCYGTLVTKDPVTSWYVVDIYENLQGEYSITDIQLFDLADYIEYGEPEDDIDDDFDDDDTDDMFADDIDDVFDIDDLDDAFADDIDDVFDIDDIDDDIDDDDADDDAFDDFNEFDDAFDDKDLDD